MDEKLKEKYPKTWKILGDLFAKIQQLELENVGLAQQVDINFDEVKRLRELLEETIEGNNNISTRLEMEIKELLEAK